MLLLKCKLCAGEVDFIGNDKSIFKKVKCNKCGFTNENTIPKIPEIIIIRKNRNSNG